MVTGASGSMGSAAVRMLAARGEPVLMVCRNPEKGASVREAILQELPDARLTLFSLDLSSLTAVRDAATRLKSEGVRLKGLFNNAGVIQERFRLNPEGLEQTLAVNYLAPWLLTRSLLDILEPDAAIVNMVSLTCRFVPARTDLLSQAPEAFSQLGTYARSKLCLLLFSLELARRTSFRVNVADPGVVNSNMLTMHRWFDPIADRLFRPWCKTPEQGAFPAVQALLGGEREKYYIGNDIREISERYYKVFDSQRLWSETETLLSERVGILMS